MKLEKLANFVDAILDQTTGNEIKISVHKDERGFMNIVVADNLSEIASVYELFPDKALTEAFEQLESFVDDLSGEE
jgi:hypothetical protein